MRKLSLALAILMGLGIVAAQGVFAQEDCSQIEDADERAACEQEQGN